MDENFSTSKRFVWQYFRRPKFRTDNWLLPPLPSPLPWRHCRFVCVVSEGWVYVEEWRLVVRRDAVGDTDAGKAPSVWQAQRWRGTGQLSPPARRRHRRPRFAVSCFDDAGPAEQLSPRDLRPDARVLASGRSAKANLPWDAHVPAAQELRLQPGRRTPTLSSPADCQRRLTSVTI